MRVKTEHIKFLKRSIKKYLPDAAIYLIGSRANDELKGGDIDILVIDEKELSGQEKRNIKLAFYKELGEQKLDIVSTKRDDRSNFKEIALLDSVKL
ncbi:MAG: nucleotidyltransferase domain-containing protein [Nitrospinales bacterium]